MPIVSGVREFCRQYLSYCLKRLKKESQGYYELPTVHGNLGADGGASKNFGELQPPSSPAGTIPAFEGKTNSFNKRDLLYWQEELGTLIGEKHCEL